MRRTPPKRKQGRSTIVGLDRRSEVEWRCKGRCEARLGVCTGKAQDIHHLLPRSAGGSNDLCNLLGVCRACHTWIEHHRADAYERGLLRHRWDGEYADDDEMARVLFGHAR